MNRVRFGNVVKEFKDNVDRSNNPYAFFVAGDHMDTEELYIKRKGCFKGTDVGPAFTRIFKPGQVLYGSRRTYLKKVAMANFEGITANTTFVLESKDETKLLTKLLPFIMYSNEFTQYSISHSKGSTNPYILFKDLENYEFNLPELEEQKKLAEVLWQIVDTMESYKKLLAKTDEMVKAKFVEMFGNDLKENNFKFKKLSEIGSCKNGINFTDKENGNCIHCLGVSDFQNFSEISNCEKLPSISLSEYPSKDYLLKNNDIVFVRSNGNKELVGRSVLVYPNDVDTTFSGFCIRFRIETDDIIPKFLLSYLKTDKARKDLRGRGANIQNLNQQMLSNLLVPVPPIEQQKSFIDIVQKSEELKAAIQSSLDSLSAIYKKIIAENLGGSN